MVLVLFVIMLHKWVKKGYPSGKGFLVQWNGFAGGKDFVRGRSSVGEYLPGKRIFR